MSEAPKRIWAGPSVDDKGEFWDVGHWDADPDEYTIPYILEKDHKAEVERLRAENDLLSSANKVTEDMVAHQTEQFHIEYRKARDLEAENARLRDALSQALKASRSAVSNVQDYIADDTGILPLEIAIEDLKKVISEADE